MPNGADSGTFSPAMSRPLPARPLGPSVWLLAALLVASTPRGRAADPQPYTVEIAATGDGRLDSAMHDAATLISLREAAPVGPFALVARARADRERFLAALHSLGYYAGSVHITIGGRSLDDPNLPSVLDATPTGTSVAVAVTVTPGPRFHLGQIALLGQVPVSAGGALGLQSGQPAVAADVLAARERLLKALLDSGYALARVDPPVATLRADSKALDVSFTVNPGPRVDLGPIAIAGLKRTNESFIRRRLLIRQGQPFNPDAIEAARQDLAATGIFSTVRITPAATVDAEGQLPLAIDVTERPPRSVSLSAAYSTDLGGSVSANWTHHNLLGDGEQLSLTAAATELGGLAAVQPGYTFDAKFTVPDWRTRGQTLTLDMLAERQYLVAYDQTAAILSATLSRRLSPNLTAGVGIAGEEESITQEQETRHYTLLQTPLTAQFDNTGDLLNPTHGIRAGANVTPTESFGRENSTFVIAQVSASTYLDLGGNGRTVLAARGLVGGVIGASAFAVPADQRFYAGGSGTVRGFIYQSIGPQFPGGVPIGGTGIDAGSIELRQRFGTNYGAALFVDAGQVNDSGGPFHGTPQVGLGVGARYYTSFGPLRLDVAVPVTHQPHGGSFQLYIGVGQAF